MNDAITISISIARAPGDVYRFARDGRNLPLWAEGLAASSVERDGDGWIVDAPFGRARATFAPDNEFGVLDHDVELESGLVVRNPMRVVANGGGSEFLFTLIRQDGMTEEEYARDKAAVEKDLRTLKALLEREGDDALRDSGS